jgi:hypothetical protein
VKTYTPKPVRLPDAVRHTDEGNPYTEPQWQRFEPRPVPPLNLRRAGELAVVGLAFALMVAAAAWSTVSIGVVLRGGVGYAVAGVFDVGWGVCLLLENLFLHDDDRLRLIRRTGWGLLAFTMAVLFARGAVEHNWLLAVAGCAGSGFAKAVWYVTMRCLEPDLTHDDKVNIRADRSRAQRAALRADMDADAARRTAYADARRAALLPPVPVAAESVTAEQVPNLADAEIDWSELEESVTAPAQVTAGSEVPNEVPAVVRNQFGTDVRNRSELLRNLIAAGTTDTAELRASVEDAGFAAPSPEYVRRLVRKSQH